MGGLGARFGSEFGKADCPVTTRLRSFMETEFMVRIQLALYPETQNNVTLTDTYFGRAAAIIEQCAGHRTSPLVTPQARRLVSTPRRGQHSVYLLNKLLKKF